MRKTKIVCTMGPSTDKPGILRQLMENGMNVARFNFSHGDYEEHKGRFDKVRALSKELDLPIACMLDTKGPEIRLGEFKNGVEKLTTGQKFTLTSRSVEGTNEISSVTYKELPHDVKPGGRIMLDDGLIELRIDEVGDTDIVCTVCNDGIIKTKKGAHLVSSCFIMVRGDEMLAMGDCAINIDYQDNVDKVTGEVTFSAAQKLAEVAIETAKTAEIFGMDPKVAMLSFSTKGSGKGGTVALSHDAVIKAQEMAPELAIDGELQFDAAVAPEVAQVKCKGSKVAGQANTFIFPCIEAGNIGYKIAQRLGGYAAYGPILQGLNAPINDLSRGCNADEVYKMSLITACQS